MWRYRLRGLTGLLVLAVSVTALFFALGLNRQSHEEPLVSEEVKEPSLHSVQKREGVQKDLLFDVGEERRQARLRAKKSTLFLQQSQGKICVIEHLDQVQGVIQQAIIKSEEQPNGPSQILVFLHCDDAKYDYDQGIFTGNAVHFSRYGCKGIQLEEEIPADGCLMEGSCETVKASIAPLGDSAAGQPDSQIVMQGNVVFSWPSQKESQRDFTVCADKAIWQTDEGKEGGKSVQGIIRLFPNEGEGRCQLESSFGDLIFGSTASYDMQQSQLVVDVPEGTVFLSKGLQDQIHFSAKTLVWSQADRLLYLKGNVAIDHGDAGKMKTENLAAVAFDEGKSSADVKWIEVYGPSTFDYVEAQSGKMHHLRNLGITKINHLRMEARLLSPKELDGCVLPSRQLSLTSDRGKIFADKAFVKYERKEEKLVPIRIVLEGNVLLKHAPVDKGLPEALQYILAHKADIYLETGDMIVKGNQNERVVLVDQGKNMKISAPEVRIRRDPTTGKESIKGKGDVRMSLSDGELARLAKFLPVENKTM